MTKIVSAIMLMRDSYRMVKTEKGTKMFKDGQEVLFWSDEILKDVMLRSLDIEPYTVIR